MLKSVTGVLAAGAIALATVSVPSKAEANPGWVIPALIVGGVVLAASAAAAHPYYYAPAGAVYVQPRVASRCRIVRERTSRGWRRVRICG
jgi:hypothetical protein